MREYLPPTVLQQELAKQINDKLELGLKISFHRRREEGTEDPVHVMIFQFGPRSKVTTQSDEFFDAAGIVRAAKRWRESLDLVMERYTTEMPEGFFDGPSF